ncbi:hypothetical protein BVRB_1g016580 [Beta vulgaris subsp. vulgaris]|nr:hypothetical protein BVRB_1g016580 [Beta vulgaris subsp. vulgaris]
MTTTWGRWRRDSTVADNANATPDQQANMGDANREKSEQKNSSSNRVSVVRRGSDDSPTTEKPMKLGERDGEEVRVSIGLGFWGIDRHGKEKELGVGFGVLKFRSHERE